MEGGSPGLLSLNPHEASTTAALFERIFPADEGGPGAVEIGAVTYLDRALSGVYQDDAEAYHLGLEAIDRAARGRFGAPFARCAPGEQDALISALEGGELPDFRVPDQRTFFWALREHAREGIFSDPAHRGNRDKLGWRFLGHPGVWLEHSAEENLATEPVTKGGEIRSLKDAGFSLKGAAQEPDEIPGYDPQIGAEPPSGPADVVLVGVGAVGSIVAPILARAGLRVVGLEAGPYRTRRDFVPDELGSSYYARGAMGRKFLSERPRWRLREGAPTRDASFMLGRMMNGVGGSVIHWGGALRRCHQHHFAYRTYVRENFGEKVLPDGHTLVDWPVTYDELEPYYTRVEYMAGVAGDGDANPFVPRSKPYPMPPMRPFRTGEIFREATEAMGLHPYPTPVAANSVPYNGFPANTYTPWSGAGFGPCFDDRWYPALTSVPEALATGNFDLRTRCRVVRILTGDEGHAGSVEYVDAAGETRVQEAVRNLVGDGIDLMVDANMAWDADEALERGKRLERHKLYWYEEPTIPEDVAGHARISRALDVPVAIGESLHSPHEFRRYVDGDAASVLHIDPITNGGITASLEALRMAGEAGLSTSSHYTDELSAHLLCASKNPVYLEKHAFALDPYLEQPQVVVDGRVRPTETPGTGLRFDAATLKPFQAH